MSKLSGNNINIDPQFNTAGYRDDNGTPSDTSDDYWVAGDYHLNDISQCIDTGNNSAPSLPATDYEGESRVLDGDNDAIDTVDIGADEYTAACSLSARIDDITPSYYSFLQDAYNAAFDGDTLQSQAVIFTGGLDINLNKTITLQCGYDCDYSTNTADTIVQGNMTISDGKLIIDSGTLIVE